MFYIVIFSILAVVLVVGGLSAMSRRRRRMGMDEEHAAHRGETHQQRKAKRTQSKHDRRKRH
jgi:hypothetical protein